MFGLAIITTTGLEAIMIIVNLVQMIDDNLAYCDLHFAAFYMVTSWGIRCNWAITFYFLLMSIDLAYFIYASLVALALIKIAKHRREMKEVSRLAEQNHNRILTEQMHRDVDMNNQAHNESILMQQ